MIHDPGDMGALHPAGSALAGAGESAAQGDRQPDGHMVYTTEQKDRRGSRCRKPCGIHLSCLQADKRGCSGR